MDSNILFFRCCANMSSMGLFVIPVVSQEVVYSIRLLKHFILACRWIASFLEAPLPFLAVCGNILIVALR